MEKKNDEEPNRGHALYVRHLLLLFQAAPVALKGYICRKVRDCNGNLADLIDENKDTFYNNYNEELQQLFRDDNINDNIDSWDVRLRCVVILSLFHSESDSQGDEVEAIACILDQMKDLDNYVQSASLDYKTFETKWKSLHAAVIELIKEIDDESQFECKRMIHSCQFRSISISSERISYLEETNDVKKHFELALQIILDTEDGNHGSDEQDEMEKFQHVNTTFTERLQDKFVDVDDSAVLTCKLNVSEETVTWRHDHKQIEDSETMKILQDGCHHWLAISRAKLEDAGLYSCTCCNGSTKAFLRVSEKHLTVIKELHVATEKADVGENMDIVLVCKVNHHTSNATWRHNGEGINSNRHHISLNDNVHTLTILKAQFEDEGEYTVDFGTTKSKTEVTLKENLNLEHKKQLTHDLYRNWIRGALGLKYLKLGLEDVSRSITQNHHRDILTRLSFANICTQCTAGELLPAHQQQNCPKKSKCICSKHRHMRKSCPNGGFCSKFFDLVLFDHRFNELLLTNTNIQNWANDPWSVAKCYISTTGYRDKSSEKEIDCAGLLSLFINNTFFQRSLNQIEINGETDVFKKARDTRNDILHNANYELSKGQLNYSLNLFVSVLEAEDVNGKQPLSSYPGTKQAIANLNLLRRTNIDISIAGDFQKHLKELKEHAKTEIAKKVEEAEKQNNQKLQHLEERLTETEQELQLMRNLRSSQMKRNDKTDSQVVFKLDLHLQVIEQTGEISTQGNLRIFRIMKNYHCGLKMRTDQCTPPTDGSVQRLLEYIKDLKHCKIADIHVSRVKPAVVVTIVCSTCEAIETSLRLINGNGFNKELMELRRCLEMYEHLKIYGVVVSCSSESLENTRQSLSKQTQIKDFTCGKHNLEYTWYCPDHDEFFCPTCKDVDHGRCIGIKQIISDRSHRKQKLCLVSEHNIDKYDVRLKNKDNDNYVCVITSIRMLPNDEFILVDFNNSRLKKLDQVYNIVGHCDFQKNPRDVCCTGNDMAVVSLAEHGIRFVNVSGKMKLKQHVELGHECHSLVCHGESLYVGDGKTIYRYNKDCQQRHDFYTYHDYGNDPYICFPYMAVSDDGERIYCNGINGLITIDKDGNHLYTLTFNEAGYLLDVCDVGNGTILVSDTSGGVYQVDYKEKNVLGTVLSPESGFQCARPLCFDRLNCRLLVTREGNYITVFQLKKYEQMC